MSGLADFQNSIYLQGLGDVLPTLPTDLTKLEGLAERSLSAQAFGYVAGSAGSEATARANRAAFDRWRIVPRMLRDVAERNFGGRPGYRDAVSGHARTHRRPVHLPSGR